MSIKVDTDLLRKATYEYIVVTNAMVKVSVSNLLNNAADELDRLHAELAQWRTSTEALAVRIMGQKRYDNSPCQAHPLELVEEYVEGLHAYNVTLLAIKARLEAQVAALTNSEPRGGPLVLDHDAAPEYGENMI